MERCRDEGREGSGEVRRSPLIVGISSYLYMEMVPIGQSYSLYIHNAYCMLQQMKYELTMVMSI